MTMRVMLAVVAAASVAASVNAQVQKKEFPGVRNYSRVDATVGCGGQVDPAAMASLKSEGFVSFINLRLPTEEGANVEQGRAAAQAADCAAGARLQQVVRKPAGQADRHPDQVVDGGGLDQ